MPENTSLPSPNQVLGTNKPSKLPSPQEALSFKSPKLREGDANIGLPKYTTPQDLEIDKTLNFIQENSLRNMRDDERNILKNMMKNPLTSKEELSDAIVTLQGKKAKQIDNTILTPDYYMKRDEKSGNYKPVALEQGEKIPVGYHAASIWGTKLSAKDDNAWQDIGKSLVNGVVGLGAGVVDVAQSGYELVTGDESETLRSGKNAIEGLKFEKDADLERPVYNMEGITKWADLLDKDRFDFSPQALWGTFNSTAESLTEFGLGSLTGATWIKGAKALKYGYKGVDKALDLGKAGKLGAIFTGSFFTNIGDARDAAEEAGLQGRDKGAVSLGISTLKSTIDAAFGLEGKIMSNAFKASEREVFKNLIKKAEKDIAGNITPNGFKQLMKEASLEYSTLAKVGSKSGQVVKDMLEEGGNEVATDFAQNAAEQLWDKLTPDERGQFGTDALSAKSFGQYANSFLNGAISGGLMSIPSQVLKNNHDNQSINAYERVKEGSGAVNALKTDLNNALEKGEITPSEHEQALFKIDKYSQYHELTSKYNIDPKDEKRAFELSFQIEGMKTEIPTNENKISELDPIPRGEVEGKQEQVKALQKELNEIITRAQIKGEPTIGKKVEEKIAKEKEQEVTDKQEERKKQKEKVEINSKLSQKEVEDKKPAYEVHEKPKEIPEWQKDTRGYKDVPDEEFNNHYADSRLIHKWLRKHLSNLPKKEMIGKLFAHEYTVKGKGDKYKNNRTIKVQLEDGRIIKLASSAIREDSLLSGHAHTENIKEISTNENYKGEVPNVIVGVKVVDLNDVPEEYKKNMPEGYGSKKKLIKIYNKENGKFISWAKETNRGSIDALDKNGNSLYNENELDLMNHLKTLKEESSPEAFEETKKTPIKPLTPQKTVKEKAEEATSKIIEESKKKVAESKSEPTTKDKFKKAVDLYYKATEAEGATQRRNKANERKKFLEENPDIKYIDDNIKEIFAQLQSKNLLTKEGNCP